MPSMKVLMQIHPSHLRYLDASWFAPTVINALVPPYSRLVCWSSQWGSIRAHLLLSSLKHPLLFPVHTLTILSLYSHPATTTLQSSSYLPFSEISIAMSLTALSSSDVATTVNSPSSDPSIENWPVLGEHQLSWRLALKHQTWSIGRGHFQAYLGRIRNRWYCKICGYIRGAISLRPSAVAKSKGIYAYRFNYQGNGVVIVFYPG